MTVHDSEQFGGFVVSWGRRGEPTPRRLMKGPDESMPRPSRRDRHSGGTCRLVTLQGVVLAGDRQRLALEAGFSGRKHGPSPKTIHFERNASTRFRKASG